MASFGSGFASGMGQGMAMGKMLMDTYNEYDQKDKLKKAGELSPEEVSAGFTPNQQTTLDYINDEKNGYEVKKLDNGNYQYRTAGSENGWTDLEQGKKAWKLGDKTYDAAPTQAQVDRARDDARAKVLMDAGDVKGAYGLRAMARTERRDTQWEDLNQAQINDLQSLAEGKYENLKGTIDKGVERYNNAQSGPYADGHRISIDWNKNQAIVTGPKNEVVKTIPIDQHTAAQFIRSYYDDMRSAINPEYGLKSREVGAKETSARADVEYKGVGGVAERVGMANVAAHRAGIGAMNPLQAYQLQQAQKFDAEKASILDNDKLSDDQKARKIGLAALKFGQGGGTGLTKSDEAQVEYNPDTGETKYKGTVSAVEAAKAKNPALKAAMGDPKMEQPAKNQTGVDVKQDAQQATPARPDLSKWTMKPAGKTIWGEQDYVLEGPSGRMSLSEFKDKYKYDPRAEFVGRR